MRPRLMPLLAGLLTSALATPSVVVEQAAPPAGDANWPLFRHDSAGTGYSPLAQITAENGRAPAPARKYGLQGAAPAAATGRGGAGGANSEATPIVVNGVMYLPAANRVVALEPETGKEIWKYPIAGGAPSRRGVAYWAGDGSGARILFTAGRRLVALNAKTGA